MLLIVGGTILLLDAIIIAGLPLLLVATRRPKSALLCSIVIGALVVFDGAVNFDSISYPKTLPFSAIGLPTQVFPLSIFLILASIGLCSWFVVRDM